MEELGSLMLFFVNLNERRKQERDTNGCVVCAVWLGDAGDGIMQGLLREKNIMTE